MNKLKKIWSLVAILVIMFTARSYAASLGLAIVNAPITMENWSVILTATVEENNAIPNVVYSNVKTYLLSFDAYNTIEQKGIECTTAGGQTLSFKTAPAYKLVSSQKIPQPLNVNYTGYEWCRDFDNHRKYL